MLFNALTMKTIEETRLIRLKMIRDECGTTAALSAKVGTSHAQLSQWLNESPDSKTGKPRTIASASCRKIEKILGKEKGWMDQPTYECGDKELEAAFDLMKTLKPHELRKIPEIINVVRQPNAEHNNEKSGNGE